MTKEMQRAGRIKRLKQYQYEKKWPRHRQPEHKLNIKAGGTGI
jgi:hypothetical protein